VPSSSTISIRNNTAARNSPAGTTPFVQLGPGKTQSVAVGLQELAKGLLGRVAAAVLSAAITSIGRRCLIPHDNNLFFDDDTTTTTKSALGRFC